MSSLLKLGRTPAPAMSYAQVGEAAGDLAAALDSGSECLPEGPVNRTRAVLGKVDERTALAGGRTVVALAGATGSGKSSLFNLMVGAEVATVGARRPTTATPTAGVWGAEPASALLDWLGVARRHEVEALARDVESSTSILNLDGLVLLDLPDFDSRLTEHRVEADRVLRLVDVFVWVTDPQKYADARLHGDYIALLAGHEAVTMVVLNQADRLTPEALAACRSDLRRLLAADGVAASEVVVTSARTGAGVTDLTLALAKAVQLRTAAQQRLMADLRSCAVELRAAVADSEPRIDGASVGPLVEALSRAAGIPTILNAVERDYRREAWARTGWPFTRWARAVRPDPLKRLRLDKRGAPSSPGITASDVRAVLGRSSLPTPAPAARAAVDLATRQLGDRAGAGLPQAWTDAVSDAATPAGGDLGDALDQAVIGTSLRSRRPFWWVAFGALQWLLALAGVLGVGWLAVLVVLGWLALPPADTPRLGTVPYPLLLAAGGLLLGLLLGALARTIARAGGRRRRRLVAGRLHESVGRVAQDRIVAPVHAMLERHRTTREHLDRARGA